MGPDAGSSSCAEVWFLTHGLVRRDPVAILVVRKILFPACSLN